MAVRERTLIAPTRAASWSPARVRRLVGMALIYVVMVAFALITAMPFLYMITGSFKRNAEIFSYPLTLIPRDPILDNYTRLLSGAEIPFVRQFGNSALVATTQTLLSLFVASLVGWGFAKYEFRGKKPLFTFLLATMMFPGQVALVPLFLLMLRIGWLDSYLAIVIPGAVSAFGAFFMRQIMLGIPNELLDAGRIDGSSEWGLYWRIGIPLSGAGFSILAVLTFRTKSWSPYWGASFNLARAASGDSWPRMPIITPRVRRRRVMARVSTPLMPGMPWEARKSWRVQVLRPWLGVTECSRTTNPATCTWRDSKSRALMP